MMLGWDWPAAKIGLGTSLKVHSIVRHERFVIGHSMGKLGVIIIVQLSGFHRCRDGKTACADEVGDKHVHILVQI